MASQVNAKQTLTLKNEREKMSYIMGMDIGENIRRQAIDVDPDIFLKGIRDVLTGTKPLLTEQEIREFAARFQKEMMENQQALTEKNKKEGEAFLSGDKKKEGIVILPSGLQYKVIKVGIGRKPQPTDKVTIHYRARLLNGTEFDSSYRRGQPEILQVNEVMPGLMEALTLMQEGAKWLLYIPPDLGYGERGAGGRIGPNAAVLFEAELISILGKQ
ncbi:MAG: FKBP-type peptidyl-prolyl cis-trans isomerase [Deltaproteobacteria bacterium]|nr:MAG: FKBP-type peptidyl-prolyl cis-trans isomerase [Deltaproteobacteria bacterium]